MKSLANKNSKVLFISNKLEEKLEFNELDFKNLMLEDKDFKPIVKTIEQLDYIKRIHLKNNKLKDHHLLKRLLSHNRSLSMIDISMN
jgi:hypothetical protein